MPLFWRETSFEARKPSNRMRKMQPVNVNIDVKGQDIPTLICSVKGERGPFMRYIADMAEAVAHSLGVEDFLHKPERIDELRRTLWRNHPSL